ncbi:MAG TPA: hypothetical protein VGX94_08215 [Terriglobia bacterium]|nr:hypothetical protein [Terriglobia bacterium]
MVKIRFDPLVTETSQRLYGLSALIELIYEAIPDVELRERDALKQLAEHENWDFGDFSVENQFLDVKFKYSLPRSAAYSIIILLSSTVETQLLAYARKVGKQKESSSNPNDLNGSLDKSRMYIKRVSGLDLNNNARWKVLKDLQNLRNIIVHRAGKPDNNKRHRLEEMCRLYQGVSLNENPYTIRPDPELDISILSCKRFAREIELFFKDLFTRANLPVETGLWPNI